MSNEAEAKPQIRVGAHVLIQLGSELVTDVEQAILECVKNAYDADAPGCVIEVDTHETGERTEVASEQSLAPFLQPSETVRAELLVPDNASAPPGSKQLATRKLNYQGRITIEDRGQGIAEEGVTESWLVVSGSRKRSLIGPKAKTKLGRTPLGDKGLGRLGTMKLGDILLLESSTGPGDDIHTAQFRWSDCTAAATIDQIPVALRNEPNPAGFKGTKVSVLGLRDIEQWRSPQRGERIARSLAKLISPFEVTSTFPVKVIVDGVPHSLDMVTNELLKRAVAEFEFDWGPAEPNGPNVLQCTARLRKRLLTSERSEQQRERTDRIFKQDGGKAFVEHLKSKKRLKGYNRYLLDPDGQWFAELERTIDGLAPSKTDVDDTVVDPGPFKGAFYFFNLDPERNDAIGADDRTLVREMSGIAILRDGFLVRSQGDWLGLSAGWTSGSSYNLRVENTIGYFSLTGEHNYRLTEKSDREGFVEDAAFRGFLRIARHCRQFANTALVGIRRSVDGYYKTLTTGENAPKTTRAAMSAVQTRVSIIDEAQQQLDELTEALGRHLETLKSASTSDVAGGAPADALKAILTKVRDLSAGATAGGSTKELLNQVNIDLNESHERIIALAESAAVGLSARGLTHELRTHLAEIRRHASAVERSVKSDTMVAASVRSIRRSCSAIEQAASQIDPLLPRARAVKELFDLDEFARSYFEARAGALGRYGVQAIVGGASIKVRINRPRLTQVIDNLTRNSIFWMQKDRSQPARIDVAVTDTGFTFADTGPGVDPLVEDDLFELFITMKHQEEAGQGLGLFISRQLLEAEGCTIELLPDLNERGRRFRFAVNLGAVVVK